MQSCNIDYTLVLFFTSLQKVFFCFLKIYNSKKGASGFILKSEICLFILSHLKHFFTDLGGRKKIFVSYVFEAAKQLCTKF